MAGSVIGKIILFFQTQICAASALVPLQPRFFQSQNFLSNFCALLERVIGNQAKQKQFTKLLSFSVPPQTIASNASWQTWSASQAPAGSSLALSP
jgi:hypothetical protein